MSQPGSQQCVARVWKRDTYRYTGRGKSGFEMHYSGERCRRMVAEGEWCWQHREGGFGRYDDRC